jgi:phage baseplate assembly protein W
LGSGLQELLFDFNDDFLADEIEEVITNSMEKWLPYVTIEEIDVRQTDEFKDTNRVEISLTFSITNNVGMETVTFTV